MRGLKNIQATGNAQSSEVAAPKIGKVNKLLLVVSIIGIAVATTLTLSPLEKTVKRISKSISSDKSNEKRYDDKKGMPDAKDIFVLGGENNGFVSPLDSSQYTETIPIGFHAAGEDLLYSELYNVSPSEKGDTSIIKAESPLDSAQFMRALDIALKSIKSLNGIKKGGIPLKYSGSFHPNRPETIDLFPKTMIASYLPYSIIKIGKRMFKIIPDYGLVVGGTSLDSTEFAIKVCKHTLLGNITIKTVSKAKDGELGIYFLKLWNKGEEGYYSGSSVEEIPLDQQEALLKELEALNTKEE